MTNESHPLVEQTKIHSTITLHDYLWLINLNSNNFKKQEIQMLEQYINNMSLKILWGKEIRQGSRPIDNGSQSKTLRGGWVPASHDFSKALDLYLQFRKSACEFNDNFGIWLKKNNHGAHFEYVANSNEFDLANESIEFIKDLINSDLKDCINDESLRFLNGYKLKVVRNEDINWGWDKFPKYIMNVYFTGLLSGYSESEKKDILLEMKYAGTLNAAGAILTVGKSFGRHFSFLDENYKPTALFKEYFSYS